MRVEVPIERVSHIAVGGWVSGNGKSAEQIRLATEDGCKRLLMPSMETEMCLLGKKRADETAIQVFRNGDHSERHAPPHRLPRYARRPLRRLSELLIGKVCHSLRNDYC